MSKNLLALARSQVTREITWRHIVSALILMLSLAFLGYKVYTSWDALKGFDWQIRYLYFVPSFALFLLQLIVIVWGWQSLMSFLAAPLPFRRHLKIYGYTNMMRRFPAGTLWMVAGRVYAYRSKKVTTGQAALGSFLEHLLSVLCGLPLAALAASGLDLLPPLTGIVLAASAFVLEFVVIHPSILSRVVKLVQHETLEANLTYRNTLALAFIHNLIWLISGCGLFLVACLFAHMPIESLPATLSAWVLSGLISYLALLSPSGLGLKELSLTVLLGIFLPDPLPLLTALGIRIVWTVYDVVVGVIAWML